jgi:hypothetical protein
MNQITFGFIFHVFGAGFEEITLNDYALSQPRNEKTVYLSYAVRIEEKETTTLQNIYR